MHAAGFGTGDGTGRRIEWRSAVVGGLVVVTLAYVGMVRPARHEIARLEGHVARLAASVEALNASRDGVSQATSLLARLEAQADRLASAEATLRRFEGLAEGLTAQSAGLDEATAVLDRSEELHRSLAARTAAIDEAQSAVNGLDSLVERAAGTSDVAARIGDSLTVVETTQGHLQTGLASLADAVPAAERLAGVADTLARGKDQAIAASEGLDRLLALRDGLARTTTDLRAAEGALVRLTDLAVTLSDASGAVGQLQRFVVDVMLLEPAVARAMRALGPVVEFTETGRRIDADGAAVERTDVEEGVAEVARAKDEGTR